MNLRILPKLSAMRYRKVCVEVTAKFSRDGGVKPLSLVWEDGRRLEVDRVKAVERAPARVSALLPIRYTCVILGRERWLYLEPDKMRWFVEAFGES